MNEIISDGGDYRTAPATPGLFVIVINVVQMKAEVWSARFSLNHPLGQFSI